jgi:hypothetical protein
VLDLAELDTVRLSNLASETALDGDYNDNGSVDAADYAAWRDNLGMAFPLRSSHRIRCQCGERRHQFPRLDRLGQVFLEAVRECPLAIRVASRSGQGNNRKMSRSIAIPAAQLANKLISIHTRHVEVAGDNGWPICREKFHRLICRFGCKHLDTTAVKDAFDCLPGFRVVVDNQNQFSN